MARKQPITTADLAEIAALTDLHIGSIHHLLHRLETGGLDFAPDINAVTEIANLGSALTQLATQCLFRMRIQADQERLRSELEKRVRASS